MSAHTPGPWEIEDREERQLIWADHAHDFVAQLSMVAEGADDDEQEKFEAEQAANARLIAAAPELLEALKSLDPQCITVPACGSCVGCDARAAIAKAEGK
jgi:hypothetical protein